MFTKRERLDELYRRLDAAPAPRDRLEALALLARLLTEVEDELSGIEKHPDPPVNLRDGRMYPPKGDLVYDVPARPRVKRFRSTRHDVFIGDNGAIEIRALTGMIEFTRAGADERSVSDL